MKVKRTVFQTQECLNQDEILSYLEERSDDDTRYRVENHLLDCPLCSAAMEGFADQDTDSLAQDFDFLQKSIKTRVAGETNHTSNPRQAALWINRIAAAILVLIIPLAGLIYWNSQTTQSRVMAQYDSSSEIVEGLRSAELLPETNEYKEGLDMFQREDFEGCELYFDDILEVQKENSFARFYSGLSAFQSGEMDKAIEQLTIVRFNDETYYEHASFYLILAYIRQGKKEDAKGLIEDVLKNEGSFYMSRVKEIANSLDNVE